MSLRAVAKEMGFNNEQVLFTRLSGKSKMSVDELEQLARILQVEVSGRGSERTGCSVEWSGTSLSASRRLSLSLSSERRSTTTDGRE